MKFCRWPYYNNTVWGFKTSIQSSENKMLKSVSYHLSYVIYTRSHVNKVALFDEIKIGFVKFMEFLPPLNDHIAKFMHKNKILWTLYFVYIIFCFSRKKIIDVVK